MAAVAIGCMASARTKGTVVMLDRRVSPHSVPRPGRSAGSDRGLSISAALGAAAEESPPESDLAAGGGAPGADCAAGAPSPKLALLALVPEASTGAEPPY